MKAVGWILLVAGFFLVAPVGALVVGAYQSRTGCETDLEPVAPPTGPMGKVVLHIENENLKGYYTACLLDPVGANLGRYAFNLDLGARRTLAWDVPASGVEYRVGFGGLTFGGAAHAAQRIDLARCPDHHHEAILTARSHPFGNSFDLTAIRCDLAQSTSASVETQGTWVPWAGRSPPLLGWGVLGLLGGALVLFVHRTTRWPLGLVALFTRLSQPQVVQHVTRSEIRQLVSADPGINLKAIAERLELSRSVAHYHLQVLCRSQVLVEVRLPGSNCYFVRGEFAPHRMTHLAVLRAPVNARTYEAIRLNPAITLTELSQELGVTPSSASKVAKRLVQAGLVRKSLRVRQAVFHDATNT